MTEDDNETTMEDEFKRIERNLERSKYTLFPDSTFKQLWDMGSFVLIVYWSLCLPFTLAFEQMNDPNTFLSNVDSFTICWFLVDILLHFNTGYFVKGVLVMSRKKIILSYLQSWFALDLLASFPYDWVLQSLQNKASVRIISS